MSTIICRCMNVTDETIKEAIANGAKTVEDIQDETSAGTCCGGCNIKIQEMLDNK